LSKLGIGLEEGLDREAFIDGGVVMFRVDTVMTD
jgi:hypothetical protein